MDEELLKRYKKSLEGLTVGGSEYWNSPERCARDIQDRIDWQWEHIKKLTTQRNKIFSMPIIGWIVKRLL